MGWTGTRERVTDVTGFLRAEEECDNHRWIDYALVGSVLYVAVEKAQPVKEVYALVILTERNGGEFMWKVMDETVGPVADRCPRQILERLSPTTPEWAYAPEWRRRCWARYGLATEGRGALLPDRRPGEGMKSPQPWAQAKP